MTNQERLRELQKSLDIDNILLAEAFIETNLKQLKIRKNTKLYVAAVDFIASKIKRGENIISKRDLTQLQKDEANKTAGAVHKKLKTEFENIVKLYAITVDPTPVNQRISPLPNPNPSPTNQNPARKPEVKLTSNVGRVPKGGTVTLTWTSKNATRIKRTNIPGVKNNQLNGTIDVPDIRRRRDFYIVVEAADKQSAEDKVVTLIETQRFLQGKDDPPSTQSQRQQRQTSAPPVSGGGGTSDENKEPVIETRSNSLNDDILSSIDKSLENIHKILKSQLKLNENVLVTVRRLSEEERRQLKEEEMEKGGLKEGLDMMKDAGKKILSPFKDIIDKIVRFIFFTFLGRAFTEIIKWFNDPQNKDKVEAMGRFLKDFWPLIAGAAVLFLTPLGGLILKTVKFFTGAVKTLKALGKILKITKLGKLGKFALTNPYGLALTTTTVGSVARIKESKRIQPDLEKINKQVKKELSDEKTPWYKKLGLFFAAQETSKFSAESQQVLPTFAPGTSYSSGGTVISNILNNNQIKNTNNNQIKTTNNNIFSGLVTHNDGIKISGAGEDTQMFPIVGGNKNKPEFAALKVGELVLQPKAVDKLLKLGIDPLALNEGPSANKPKTLNSSNISLMNTGGVVGGGKLSGPKISAVDYNTLLAMTALESDNPQGRADVAQSIYNRMLAASKYGVNFMQRTNSLKDLIIAPKQYQPMFGNPKDWHNISADLNSAIIAVMNSDKGKRYKWTEKEALAQIRATEKAIKDPILQKNAAMFVKGIPSFRGVSEQGSMRPDLGDVLRNKKDNFFTTLDLEKTPYPKSQWKIPAPIPQMLVPKPQEPSKPKEQPNLLQQAGQFFGGAVNKVKGLFTPKKKKGGLISSSSGENLEGVASDNILSRLEKGEYVIPKMAVALIGTDLLDRVSALDPNSEAYPRVSRMELNIATPRPISKSMPQMSTETLPPIMQGGYGGTSGGYGTPIPPIASNSSQEQAKAFNASILGII